MNQDFSKKILPLTKLPRTISFLAIVLSPKFLTVTDEDKVC